MKVGTERGEESPDEENKHPFQDSRKQAILSHLELN